MTSTRPVPPRAATRPVTTTTHGEPRTDDYAWLRDREDPAVRTYLETENAYLDAVLAPERALQDELYEDILARIQQTDEQPPVPWGPYQYFSRTVEGENFPVYVRRPREGGEDEVLLDLNAMAREGGHEYVQVGRLEASPDHRLVAYTLDTSGAERYDLRFLDTGSGASLDVAVEDVSGGSLAWSANGTHVFFVRNDAAWRPHEVHRLTLADRTSTLVRREDDETFRLSVARSHTGRFVLVSANSTTTDEVSVIDASAPEGELHVLRPRERGVEYLAQDAGDEWLVLTNEGGATNFRLVARRVDGTLERELLPHRDDVMLVAVRVFASHVVLLGRENGLTALWVARRDRLDGVAAWRRVPFAEPVYTVRLGENREFDTRVVRLVYTSFTTPTTTYDLDLESLELTVVKQTPVLGGYDAARYVSERAWATASDGTRVPISLVKRRDTPLPAPTLLIGYGSYGFSYDPAFSTARLALLDRGWVVALAHIRGGGEMGRAWYEHGKLRHKRNTFTDFVACAEHLVAQGLTTPRELVASGGSAGGLLMGAVLNDRPDLFRAVIAHVPFVDVINTMLDATIPLTTLEYDEWGNPNDPADYAYIRTYSPYDNVTAVAYPHLLVTTGLNDPRVAYWEPAKWVARLRTVQQGSGKILLRTNFGAGHGGAAGRYDALRELAQEYAFAIAAVEGRLDG